MGGPVDGWTDGQHMGFLGLPYHRLGGFTQQQFILSHFWRPEVQSQGVGRVVLSEGHEGESITPNSQLLVVASSHWHFLCLVVQLLSRVQLFATPWTVAHRLLHCLPEFAQIYVH